MKKLIFSAIMIASVSTLFAQDQADFDKLKQDVKELQVKVDSLETKLAQVMLMAVLSGGASDSEVSLEAMLMLMALAASSDSEEQAEPIESGDQGAPGVLYGGGNSQGALYGNSGGKSDVSYVTEKEALAYIEDHYGFYNTNYTYRNVQLRRVADNEFKVSIQERLKEGYSWHGSVMTLVVNSDGEYRFYNPIY